MNKTEAINSALEYNVMLLQTDLTESEKRSVEMFVLLLANAAKERNK